MVEKRLSEIADILGGNVIGDGDVQIKGVATLPDAQEGDISYVRDKKSIKHLEATQASAVIIPEFVSEIDKPAIKVKNSHVAFAKLIALYYLKTTAPTGVHEKAFIGKNVKLGKDLSVYPFSYIGDDVEIGDRCLISPYVFIGKGTKIGDDTVIYPNVSIYHGIVIGNRVLLHPGAVVGSDGFSFAPNDGKHYKIPQVGNVVVGDDVEIGANACVDRAALKSTLIGAGTKVDNLVQVAHNVEVGENSVLVSQCGISGSTKIGKNVTLAGQVGVAGHVNVGDNTVAMAKSAILQDIPANSIVVGMPAIEHKTYKRIVLALPRLPELIKTIKALGKRIEELEEKTQK